MPISRSDLVASVGEACDLGTAALFVGAGLSRSAGLPGWGELLKGPCQEAGVPFKEITDLPLLAEYLILSGDYGRPKLEQHILQSVTGSATQPTDVHRAIARLPIDQIWTTNYDTLIEQSIPGVNVVDLDRDIKRISSSSRSVIKMHGSVSTAQPPAWTSPPVITRSDFETYETSHRRTWAMLLAAHLSRTFLFLGFSFADPNVEILQRLARVHGTATGNRHMTVMRRPDPSKKSKARLHELRVNDLEASGVRVHEVGDHGELDSLLSDLVRRTRPPTLFLSGSSASDRFDSICRAVAQELAGMTDWQICSLGGPAGWETTKAIARIRRAEGTYDPARLVFQFRRHERPAPTMDERVGTAVFSDQKRKSLVNGLLDESRALIALGGGARTAEEIKWAETRGVGIVPLAASGGAAHSYWKRFASAPPPLGGRPTDRRTWKRLNSDNTAAAARAAAELVSQAMYAPTT
jgi:hypothetical protein